VRDTALNLPESFKSRYQGGSTYQSEGDTLLIEKNREDLVYGALRRINSGLTQRVSLDTPLVGIWTLIFISFSFLILNIALASSTSAAVTRDLTIATVNEVAIRS
jgi:hypothetical protein